MLLKQDKTEALMSVNGRLEFIEKEIRRFETQIKGIQEKAEKVKVEVWLPNSAQEESKVLTTCVDYTDSKRSTAATASTSSSIEVVRDTHEPEAK